MVFGRLKLAGLAWEETCISDSVFFGWRIYITLALRPSLRIRTGWGEEVLDIEPRGEDG